VFECHAHHASHTHLRQSTGLHHPRTLHIAVPNKSMEFHGVPRLQLRPKLGHEESERRDRGSLPGLTYCTLETGHTPRLEGRPTAVVGLTTCPRLSTRIYIYCRVDLGTVTVYKGQTFAPCTVDYFLPPTLLHNKNSKDWAGSICVKSCVNHLKLLYPIYTLSTHGVLPHTPNTRACYSVYH